MHIIEFTKTWLNRNLGDPQAILLLIMLVLGFGVVILMGEMLAPALASIVIAYVLTWFIEILNKYKIPRVYGFTIVYTSFLALFAGTCLLLAPLLSKQIMSLLNDLPDIIQKAKDLLFKLQNEHPNFLSKQQLDSLMTTLRLEAQNIGKYAIFASIASIPGILTILLYIFLIPLLVFFFIKDHKKIIKWFTTFLPEDHSILSKVWREVDKQIGNYIRGKLAEISIAGLATYIVFFFAELNYQILLATLVGLSVLVPYVGLIVVSIPVILISYMQFGFGPEFIKLNIAYFIVQALDGVVLVPLLFSEAVNLHPISIILAILVFGHIWGFWGVFFAIPLATLVKAVLHAWPKIK